MWSRRARFDGKSVAPSDCPHSRRLSSARARRHQARQIPAHAAVAKGAYRDEERWRRCGTISRRPIGEPLRATLRMLRTLVRERTVSASDMAAVLLAGVSRAQVEDALAVCFAFN